MGKKDKKKNKISGSEKTALKTEKKLNAKQKKELAARGEDDIEKVIAEIEKEEARRQKVIEHQMPTPSRRVNFSFTAHPLKEELIMYGGEFHDGQRTNVYGDLFFYNINKNEWTLVKAPGAPPPRCGHQAVAVPSNKGELWIFGGEFTSPSESQFYHYKDLWVYHLGDKKWERVNAPGGPSSRSGHRMTVVKKCLFVFGGFYDNLRDYKYYNDLHCFNMSTYTWNKIEISGIPPAPRSGCIILPTPENKILVFGGYSKEKIKKDVDKGHVYMDMFQLAPEKNDQSGLKWKWSPVKQSGIFISPRCSASAVLVQPHLAYMFGGVHDEEDNDEELRGTFYNDLLALNINKSMWQSVTLRGENDTTVHKRRRKVKENTETSASDSEEENSEPMETNPSEPVVAHDDGVFTMTLGPAPTTTSQIENESTTTSKIFSPSARINPGLVVKNNVLYLFGGIFEDGDREFTLGDFYKLDCKKLDEWITLAKDDLSSQIWLESSSESGEDSDDDSDSEEDCKEENEMNID